MLVGFAVSELWETVWMFESELKTKEAVERNLSALISEQYGYPEISELRIFRAESPEGERYGELAEYAARDHIESTPGVTCGYALEGPLYVEKVTDPVKSVISRLSRDYGIGEGQISELFGSWATEYGPDADEFAKFFRNLQDRIYC